MKKASLFVSSVYDDVEGREPIEWANIWYSDAKNAPPENRVLLIGDSTARMVRSTFERMIGMPVDMLGSSSGLHDILFLKQLEALFASEHYQYSCIFIQMGHHSIRNEDGEIYTENDYSRFREDYVALINFLRQYSHNVILLTCFLNVSPFPSKLSSPLKGIPVMLWRKVFGEKIDYSWSNVVMHKNEIIREISLNEKLKFCDIDGIMRERCKGMFPKYIHKDHIHYYGEGAKIAIAREYAKFL